ncbi:hypothetical protein Salat_1876200 [Sesamum alatum]|uniref:Uncharacterized protein n=1 Tax=Sesamum alatum TaxID=300844 RepID=A0AAE1Y371_9LAMI|nr:hypothetical protein Salat_1876200 [Sesamum alatum]
MVGGAVVRATSPILIDMVSSSFRNVDARRLKEDYRIPDYFTILLPTQRFDLKSPNLIAYVVPMVDEMMNCFQVPPPPLDERCPYVDEDRIDRLVADLARWK